jgi:pre-mRNA-processing factor 17
LGFCQLPFVDPHKQNHFLVGCQDKRIIQYDVNSGKAVQTYEEHLGAVNTITFVDNARRFITTSDDKTIRIWEWGIPVVIKHISEPYMHSLPAIALSPNNNYFLAQSMDNQILVYNCRDRYSMVRKKVFKGHNSAGYACQLGWSPDSQ